MKLITLKEARQNTADSIQEIKDKASFAKVLVDVSEVIKDESLLGNDYCSFILPIEFAEQVKSQFEENGFETSIHKNPASPTIEMTIAVQKFPSQAFKDLVRIYIYWH